MGRGAPSRGERALDVILDHDRLRFGERLAVSFHRTLRIPDDGRTYPLPPGFGLFPLLRLGGEIIVPLYQREALWLGFSAAPWKPNALKVIVGGINAVSGVADDGTTLREPQDYLVCPDQPWLDGFNAGGGIIRQFVAMPLGQGYAIEAGAGRPEQGGLEIVAIEPKPGRFPDKPPPAPPGPTRLSRPATATAEPREMALGAGGRMRQKIYPDRHGRAIWDLDHVARVRLRLVNSRRWRELTGTDPPPTPIDAEAYTAAGLPWFELYDEALSTVAPDERRRLKTIGERDREVGIDADDRPVDVSDRQVSVIDRGRPPNLSTDEGSGRSGQADTPLPHSPHQKKGST